MEHHVKQRRVRILFLIVKDGTVIKTMLCVCCHVIPEIFSRHPAFFHRTFDIYIGMIVGICQSVGP